MVERARCKGGGKGTCIERDVYGFTLGTISFNFLRFRLPLR